MASSGHNVTLKLRDKTQRFSASFGPGKLPPYLNNSLLEALKKVPGVEDVKSNRHWKTAYITFIPKDSIQKKGMFNNLSAVFARFGYKLNGPD